LRTKTAAGTSAGEWQLGKRFTGGKRITRDFDSLQEAKLWIFGDAQKSKAEHGSLFSIFSNESTHVLAIEGKSEVRV
jgi:hypothetical protein